MFFNINKCFILYIGKKTLNHYYNKTDHSEVYRIMMGTCFYYSVIKFSYMLLVLHPRHKLMYFENAGWEDELRGELDRYLDSDAVDVSDALAWWHST